MIAQLRELANELHREAAELEPTSDADLELWEACSQQASDRREIAARIELVLKQAMLEAYDNGPTERIDLENISALAELNGVLLLLDIGTTPNWFNLNLNVEDACKLRDFLIAALAKHEDL